MNCEQAKEISVKKVLNSLGYFEEKQKGKTKAFYFSLTHKEKDPSLLVDYGQNNAWDFSIGKLYDTIGIVQEVKHCSISDALAYLENLTPEFSKEERQIFSQENIKEEEVSYEITEITKVKHYALVEYLKKRKVWNQRRLLREVHYKMRTNEKTYFAVGFHTGEDSFELRNKYKKNCIGKKHITYIQNTAEKKVLCVFEGFMDYLSFLELYPEKKDKVDFLILNSTSIYKRVFGIVAKYTMNCLFFDNDKESETGKKTINRFKLYFYFVLHKNPDFIKDMRYLYAEHNDLNEYLMEE